MGPCPQTPPPPPHTHLALHPLALPRCPSPLPAADKITTESFALSEVPRGVSLGEAIVSKLIAPAKEIGGDARLELPPVRRIKSEAREVEGREYMYLAFPSETITRVNGVGLPAAICSPPRSCLMRPGKGGGGGGRGGVSMRVTPDQTLCGLRLPADMHPLCGGGPQRRAGTRCGARTWQWRLSSGTWCTAWGCLPGATSSMRRRRVCCGRWWNLSGCDSRWVTVRKLGMAEQGRVETVRAWQRGRGICESDTATMIWLLHMTWHCFTFQSAAIMYIGHLLVLHKITVLEKTDGCGNEVQRGEVCLRK
jgi:hypothetical protein